MSLALGKSFDPEAVIDVGIDEDDFRWAESQP